ncbi:MAG: class I SAM-dependent methyltransferase [Gammaproteobacteria bacterium]|nr:class I SAM-dependent methyltransferase [Gammaproteobacteria bacterium]
MIAVIAGTEALRAEAERIATELGLPLAAETSPEFPFLLAITPTHLELRQTGPGAAGPVYVDFTGGAANHRRRFGGGKNQPVARAVGLKGGAAPSVLDATAGLGRDTFVLASLGCNVQMVERSPIVAALLQDGVRRARQDPAIGAMVSERMALITGNAIEHMRQLTHDQHPDVVYLDPMYPPRDKSALVKKEMRALQILLGHDPDIAELLDAALHCARKRIVVKRPRHAPPIEGRAPSMAIESENTRFDVYLIL